MIRYVKIILVLSMCYCQHIMWANDTLTTTQKDTSHTFVPNFHEYSRLFNISKKYPYQKDLNLLFEANVGYNFNLFSHQSKRSSSKKFSLSINPRFRIRMLNDEQLSVVPASYLFNIQGGFLSYQSNAALAVKSFFISLNHHSNGQRGDLIGEELVNVTDGQFSTNYLSIYHTWSFLKGKNNNNVLVGFERHFTNENFPGSLSDFVGESYGTQRFLFGYLHNTNLNIGKFKNLDLRFKMDYNFLLAPPRDKKYYNVFNDDNEIAQHSLFLEFMLLPNWNSDLGFFIRYHSGQDYYNLYFFNRLSQFQFGIVIDQMKMRN